MTLKQGLKNKEFTRQKRERRGSGQKEQHGAKARKSTREAEGKGTDLAEIPVQGREWGESPVGYNTGLSGGVRCHVRPQRQDRALP